MNKGDFKVKHKQTLTDGNQIVKMKTTLLTASTKNCYLTIRKPPKNKRITKKKRADDYEEVIGELGSFVSCGIYRHLEILT